MEVEKKICAIVVTYNSEEKYLENFNFLKNQVDKIIIVDNGSEKNTLDVLKKIKLENQNKVHLILNNENIGLSKAQNLGIKYAINTCYKWVMLMDDDSKPEEKMITKLFREYDALKKEEQKKIAILCPHVKEMNVEEETKAVIRLDEKKYKIIPVGSENHMNTYVAIASGSIIKIEVLKKIGLMNEEFFIDSIDIEFCLRCIKNKYKIFLSGGAILYHTLGKKEKKNFLGKNIIVTNHNPIRKYNIYRNRIITWKKYYNNEAGYIKLEIKATFKELIKTIFFEKNKIKNIKSIILGIKDGILYKF